MRYNINCIGGKTARVEYPGKVFEVISAGVAGSVTIEVEWEDRQRTEYLGAQADHFHFESDGGRVFKALNITAAVDTVVDLLVSFHSVTLNSLDGSTVSIDPTQLPLSVAAQGVDSHDAALTAKPLTIGGYASLNAPTPVADGDAVRQWMSQRGAMMVHPYSDQEVSGDGNTVTYTGFVSHLQQLRPLGVVPLLNNGGTAYRMAGGAGGVFVQGPVAGGASASGNPVAFGADYNTTLPSYTTGQRTQAQASSRGILLVGLADGSGGAQTTQCAASSVGDASPAYHALAVMSQARVFNGATWDRLTKATSTSRLPSSAATTNATSAKASAGTVYAIEANNTTAAVKYLKLYNKASAPTVGTDAPVRTMAIPPNTRIALTFPTGYYFATGIAWALTGAAADADTTALAAGDVTSVNIDYS